MFAMLDLYGYLGRDPEYKKTPNGKDYVQLSLGVSKNSNGAVKTQWYQVKAWKPFDDIVKNLKKRGGIPSGFSSSDFTLPLLGAQV